MAARRRIVLIAAAVAALALLGAALARSAPPAPAEQLAAARARWQHRPFQRYRIVVETRGAVDRCVVDLEIAGEQTAVVHEDTCWRLENPLRRWRRGVTSLFETLDNLSTISAHQCAGCASIDTVAQYDPRLGYPARIEIYERQQRPWWRLSYWQAAWNNRRWPELARETTQTITVTALTPLP